MGRANKCFHFFNRLLQSSFKSSLKYLIVFLLGFIYSSPTFADVTVNGEQIPTGEVIDGETVRYIISVTNTSIQSTFIGIDITLNGIPVSPNLFTANPPCTLSEGPQYDCGTLAGGASGDFVFSWIPPLGSNGEATTHDLVFTVSCFLEGSCTGGDVGFMTSVRPLQPGVLQFSTDTYQAAEGNTAVITINRVGGNDGELTADVVIGGGSSDTASSADYIQPNTTVTFGANVSSRTITIPIVADELVEGDETLSLELQGNTGEIGTPSQAVLTIIDTNLPGELAFDASSYQGTEGDAVAVTIVRTGGSDGTIEADVTIGSEGDTATPTVDYSPVAVAHVTFGPGVTEQTIPPIQLVTDTLLEGDETVSLSLSLTPESVGSIGTPGDAVLTISDKNIGELNFSAASYNVAEADGEAVIIVTRTEGGVGELEVDVQIGSSGDTASTDDYTDPVSVRLTWTDGDIADKTLTIPITADLVVENDEILTLTLIPVNNAPLGTISQAVLTITDTAPEVDSVGIVSGDRQTGEIGTELNPFVVLVEDANGDPIENITINWEVTPAEGGTLVATTTQTDENGTSSNTLTLNSDDLVVVTARAADPTVEPIEFLINPRLADKTGLTENQISIATVLDVACEALAESVLELTPEQQDLLATCDRLATTEDLGSELDLLIPDEVSSQGTAVIKAANLQVMNVNARLNALRSGKKGMDVSGLGIQVEGVMLPNVVLSQFANHQTTGGAAGEGDAYSPWGAFINGNISFGSRDRTSNENGFDFDTRGITAGIDYRISNDLVVGAALGYGTNESDFDSSAGDMDMDGWHITGYGTYYKNQQIYLDGVIKLGFNNFDTSRRVSPTGAALQNAVGDTDGKDLSLSFGGGYEVARDAMSIGGYGRIGYTRADIDGYAETAQNPGVPGIGSMLSIADQDVDSLTTTLGTQLSYAISTRKGVLIPQARLEWEHEFSDDQRDINAQFLADPTSTTFGIKTDNPDRDYFNLGLGFSALTTGGKSGFLYYETRIDQDNIEQHWLKGGFRFEF